jgi:hypothetical protein
MASLSTTKTHDPITLRVGIKSGGSVAPIMEFLPYGR